MANDLGSITGVVAEAMAVRMILESAFVSARKRLKFAWYAPTMTQELAESFAAHLREQTGLIALVGAEQEPKYAMIGSSRTLQVTLHDWGVIGIFREGAVSEAQSNTVLKMLAATWWAEVSGASNVESDEIQT